MILELFYAFCAGFLGGVTGYYAFSWMTYRELWNLKVDVADLQERHLRSVRKAAAKERWDIDENIDQAVAQAVAAPKPKGWTKWPSSGRSENSSAT